MEAIERREPLTNLDWARALLLTEFGFGSDMVASARRFGRVRHRGDLPLLFIENAAYPWIRYD